MQQRQQELKAWVASKLDQAPLVFKPLAGDASTRIYARVLYQNQSYIVMDALPVDHNNFAFIEISKALQSQGLWVPEIIHQNLEQGFFVLSDLGDKLYLDYLNANTADQLYTSAMQALLKIQACPEPVDYPLPQFDRDFMLTELNRLIRWYFQGLLKWDVPQNILNQCKKLFEDLVQNAQAQPQVFVHRDYHSRNLMFCESKISPGIIDFQDAVMGPITYDLVSLLRDCYIDWPEVKITQWALQYKQLLTPPYSDCSDDQFLHWFDWMGLQRHLKVLGIFSRLHLRDNKPQYILEMPRILKYIQTICEKYEDFHFFARLLKTEILPRMSRVL